MRKLIALEAEVYAKLVRNFGVFDSYIGEYFDSYGLAPALVGLESYMNTYSLAGWIYNRKTV